jgi:hypothetical protein
MRQRTPKPYKAAQLLGFLLIAVGVIARAGAGEFWGTGLALLGVLVFACGRVAAWWRNG